MTLFERTSAELQAAIKNNELTIADLTNEAFARVEEGKTVLFVGTKKQAQECMKEAAITCGMFYIDQRWLGGMLTNFQTIRTRVERLKKLEAMEQYGK